MCSQLLHTAVLINLLGKFSCWFGKSQCAKKEENVKIFETLRYKESKGFKEEWILGGQRSVFSDQMWKQEEENAKVPIWLCALFFYQPSPNFFFVLIMTCIVLFFFSSSTHCQSPAAYRKEAECLPGNNPSGTHRLRHLSPPHLCIKKIYVSCTGAAR